MIHQVVNHHVDRGQRLDQINREGSVVAWGAAVNRVLGVRGVALMSAVGGKWRAPNSAFRCFRPVVVGANCRSIADITSTATGMDEPGYGSRERSEQYGSVINFVFGHNMLQRCMYADQKETGP